MKTIAHNKPSFDSREIKALTKVVKSGWVIAGAEVERLESTMKRYHGKKYAIATSSGHAALHLSLLALGVKKNDEEIVPAYAPSDLLNAVHYVGAHPVVVDIQKDSFNIDPERVQKKINKRTKAILVPHIFGTPADIGALQKLGIPIINDCAQSLGTLYRGKPVGHFGDVGIFSFYATKVIASGQGGMVVTDDKKIYTYIKDAIDYNNRDTYKVRYNYALTDIAASIANVQFEKLTYFLRRRKAIASRYQRILDAKGMQYFPKKNDHTANYYRFIIKLSTKKKRDGVKALFKKHGIVTIVPLNAYELLNNSLKLGKKEFPYSEEMASTNLSLPVYPALKESEVKRVCAVLRLL